MKNYEVLVSCKKYLPVGLYSKILVPIELTLLHRMLGLFVSLITLSLSTLPRHSEFKDSTVRQNQLLGQSRSRCSSAWSRWHIRLLEEVAAPECFECELKKKSALSRGTLSFIGSCHGRG